MIRLEYGDALAEAGGLSETDLGALLVRAGEARERLAEPRARGGGAAFLELPSSADLEAVAAAGEEARRRFAAIVLLGIGGSALGAEALLRALAPRPGEGSAGPRLLVLDSVDPGTISSAMQDLVPSETLVLAVSKSGETLETLATLAVFLGWLQTALGPRWKSHVTVVTDPERGPLRAFASREGIRALPIPTAVGGRWSALSAAGLLPAAAVGVDVAAVAAGARAEAARALSAPPAESPALVHAALVHGLDRLRGRRTVVFWPYADRLDALAEWYRQLLAESLGKPTARGPVGPLPVPARGPADQHALLQWLVQGPPEAFTTFLAVQDHGAEVAIPALGPAGETVLPGRGLSALLEAEREGTAASLAAAGRPSATFRLPDLSGGTVGGLLMLLQVSVAVAGDLYGADPYGQPGVEGGKRAAWALLGKAGLEAEAERLRERAARTGWTA
ncbi:MAG: glucose-6-phosphate isomerase [Planctomycetales bacterium]|nr:glucose-6-phosphate isomerase [Planctomycetales bacterium]